MKIALSTLALALACGTAFAASAGNISIVRQSGWLNGQMTAQMGNRNLATTNQSGIANGSVTFQRGIANTAATMQIGVGNSAVNDQWGSANAAATLQTGDNGHLSETTQLGRGNVSMTVQGD